MCEMYARWLVGIVHMAARFFAWFPLFVYALVFLYLFNLLILVANWSDAQSVGRSVGRSVGWLVGWLVVLCWFRCLCDSVC